MGLFNKAKKNNGFEMQMESMGNELVTLYANKMGVPFAQTTELERQVLATYFYGMSDGLRQKSAADKPPQEIAMAIIKTLQTVFRYSEMQAEQFFYSMVDNLQSGNPQNTSYAIIHRGLDGYFAWEKSNKSGVIEDVNQIINLFKG